MLTIPFGEVQGFITLPRLRPLDRIPPPFGREWALQPPHFSLQAETKALYAAMMRTVCLSLEAFLATYRWDQHSRIIFEPLAAAPGELVCADTNGMPLAAVQTLAGSSDPATPPLTKASRSRGQAHTSSKVPLYRNKIMGGVCIIGGAALLTWILASHVLPRDKQATEALPGSAERESSGAVSRRIAEDGTTHKQTLAHSPQIDAAEPSTATVMASQNITLTSGVDTGPAMNRPDYPTTGTPHPTPTATLATRSTANTEKSTAHSGSAITKSTAISKRGGTRHIVKDRHVAHTSVPYPAPPRIMKHRTTSTHSKAGHYSPYQPSIRRGDDYASITTYTNTYAALHSADRSPISTDNIEWVSHVAQRRITEAPESFEK
jgi:hypothetical protein